MALGEALRVWASGYITKLSGLVTAGPYALCRNPLYIGSFLTTLGYLVMCHNPVIMILGIIVFWLLHGGAIIYEERLLTERFGQEYADYCRSVPRLVPYPRRLVGQGSFSFRQVMVNDEYRGAASVALLAALFGAMAFCSFSIFNWLASLAE